MLCIRASPAGSSRGGHAAAGSAPVALAQAVPALRSGGARPARLRAAVGHELRLIGVDDVCCFEANDKYAGVFTADAEPCAHRFKR